jgi:hypothetical protein
VEIAKCPQCGEEVSEEDMISDQLRLALVAGMLVGAASITGMLMEIPDYLAARDGYDERLREVISRLEEDVGAFVEWGQAYD